ncbi:FkbM family methyltransferase [Candidatus Pacearchaeota archaeon]|nr:FkbM family methyltransferase [Candidatus Pacearchaeota archaeon]
MSIGSFLAGAFEKIPEWPVKNDIRYFLAFSPIVPDFIADLSPVKGYEMRYHLKRGDFVVDAGAYPGDYAVFAARKVGNEGKVIAFEPDPKNREVLKKILRYEKLNNVIIVPKGLWNENTELKIESSDGLHSKLGVSKNTLEIPVVRLDDELKNLGIKKVDVLKMDIEGAEIEALEGCVDTLRKNKVNVIIASYHIVKGKRTSYYVEDFLKKLGYSAMSAFPKHLTTYGWKS